MPGRLGLTFEEAGDPDQWLAQMRRQLMLGDLLRDLCLRTREEHPSPQQAELEVITATFTGALFHWGVAVENAAKAVLVARAAPKTEEALTATMSGLRSHDLAHLATDAGAEISGELAALLEILCEAVTWAGRYPVTLTPDRFQAAPHQSARPPLDQKAVHDLCAGLERIARGR